MSEKSSSARLANLRKRSGKAPVMGRETEDRIAWVVEGMSLLAEEFRSTRKGAHWLQEKKVFLNQAELYRYAQHEPSETCRVNRRNRLFHQACFAAVAILKRMRTLAEGKKAPDLTTLQNALDALENAAEFFGSGRKSPTVGEPRPLQ